MKNFKKLTMYDEALETTTSNSSTPKARIVKVQQRSVYHKFVELEVEVPDSVEFNDIQEWLINNDQLWSDQIDQAMLEAPIQLGNGVDDYDGMNELEDDSEWRFQCPADKDGNSYGGRL